VPGGRGGARKHRLRRVQRRSTRVLGRPVQVEPMKPTLKASGSKRLKLLFDEALSSFAFKFNLRRYIWGPLDTAAVRPGRY